MFFCLYYLTNTFFLFVYNIGQYYFFLHCYVTIILLLHITVALLYDIYLTIGTCIYRHILEYKHKYINTDIYLLDSWLCRGLAI